MERPLESRLHIDYNINDHFSQLHSAGDLDCCFMAFLSWRKPRGPRIMRKLWSNSREQTQGNEKRKGEDSSYSKGIEVLLRETARKGYPDPEEVDNPMITPQDDVVRQSGRVFELQIRDLCIRPPDLSWLFPILVIIRELPFKKYCGRSPAKLKAREDKIKEAKKQKTPKNEDQEWNSDRSSHPGPGLLHLHHLPGKNGAQTKRVSVPIGSQLIGTAQMKRARLRHGSHRSHGSEECVPYQRRHFQGHPSRRKERLFVTGDHLFVISATCSVLSCFAVSDCEKHFSFMCIKICSDKITVWLKANQSVCNSCFLVCVW